MSVPYTEVLDVKKWLNAQHILVSMEWVESCVDFVRQEYQGSDMPLQQLKSHVYQQWLLADLEEIGFPAFPPDLSTMQKIVLPNSFVLQVNGIRDIGRPAYAQLRQLEGSHSADSEVSAAPKSFQPEWESKPTRMLLLNLTDGVQFIQGMEYKPIPSLSPNLPPGLKILIKGPVDCRLGMIMLTQETVKILGGEVEGHSKKYSREEMLRENLQLSSDDRTAADPALINLTDDSENFNHQSPRLLNRNMQDNRSPQPPLRTRNHIEVDQNRNWQNSVTSSTYTLPNNEIDPDDFDCDDDDDFVATLDYKALDEIERICSQQVSSHSNDHAEVSEDEEMLNDAYAFQDQIDLFPSDDGPHSSSSDHSLPHPYDGLLSKAPFTHLSSVIEKDYAERECSITIKGFISKVLTKLSCTPSKKWQLSAKVNDDTGHIDADFHDQVLEELVGISAKDIIEMQIQAPKDPEVKQKIGEAVNGCKRKLQELNCLMEIKFSAGQLPCVVKCTQIGKSDMEQLLKRVQENSK